MRLTLAVSAMALAMASTAPVAAQPRAVLKPTIAPKKLGPVAVINLTKLAEGTEPGPLPSDLRVARPIRPENRIVPASLLPRALITRIPNNLAGASSARLMPPPRSATAAAAILGNTVFNGVSNYDQRFADNGNQFSLEPPDMAIATDGRYVLNAVNNGISVYDNKGNQLLVPVSTNRFFGLQSALNRATGQFGPSMSDPRAYYDPDSKRWFVFEWMTVNDAAGKPLGASYQFFAISQTQNPLGNWNVYSFDTTNSDLPGCPCIPDYQQIGFDKSGIFVTHNLFGNNTGAGYVAATVYALSKPGLVKGTGSYLARFVLPEDFTVHPAVVPPRGTFAGDEGGTHYFLEGLADISETGTAKAVRVFALSGTSSLVDTSAPPSLLLSSIDVPTQAYEEPFVAIQPDGLRPYATTLVKPGKKLPPVPLLDTGSARFAANPMYAAGQLWGVVSTGVPSPAGGKSALAWFAFDVSGGATTLAAKVATQGVITAPGDTSLAFGTIAMPANGRGVIGFNIAGPGNYPSTGYATLTAAGAGAVQITGIGAVPLDGFSGYNDPPRQNIQGVERWGDYSAAGVVSSSNLWVAGEYAPDPAVKPRTLGVNWGSAITNVKR